ncbi:hypothetical protein ACFFRR_010020 [Megaselia abdita]
MPGKTESYSQTTSRTTVETQTKTEQLVFAKTDEVKLANWLKRILPQVEQELLEGLTPNQQPDKIGDSTENFDINIKHCQQIAFLGDQNSHGHALWLSLYASDVPVLALTSSGSHENWCRHLNQWIKVFIPKREAGKDTLIFTEAKQISLNACIQTLSRNPFNKDVFAGGTISGDIFIWKFKNDYKSVDVEEIGSHSVTEAPNALDWLDETHLIGCLDNSQVVIWKVSKEIIQESLFSVQKKDKAKLTVIVALTRTQFVVGTDKGDVIHCILTPSQDSVETVVLKKHKFAVTHISKVTVQGNLAVYSCDLNGELFVHDLYKTDKDPELILNIPLPYKTTFCTSKDGETVFCPSEDGGLDIYRLKNGLLKTVNGNLQGKGNCIKRSDNGNWFVTGIYNGYFQIFKLDE